MLVNISNILLENVGVARQVAVLIVFGSFWTWGPPFVSSTHKNERHIGWTHMRDGLGDTATTRRNMTSGSKIFDLLCAWEHNTIFELDCRNFRHVVSTKCRSIGNGIFVNILLHLMNTRFRLPSNVEYWCTVCIFNINTSFATGGEVMHNIYIRPARSTSAHGRIETYSCLWSI